MIETRELTKKYGEVLALDHLSFKIESGQIFGYIGPNGAGKTTTIKMLVGLLKPSSGTAFVAGHDITKTKPDVLKKLVGYMPDWFGVYRQMRVWEYLDFFGAAFRMSKKDRLKRIEEVLDIAGVAAMRDYAVDSLSRGMTQRVGIARLLMHDPQVLFLDEPASGLDPRARVQMRELLKKLRGMGKTILLSSHILPELAGVCDQIGILEKSKLLAFGPVEEVMRSVRTKRVLEIELVESQSTEALAACLGQICSPDIYRFIEQEENLVRFEYNAGDEHIAELWASLMAAGWRLISCREVMGDLEEAYLNITKQVTAGERASGASAVPA
ncbi:MAG: ABC transporter ATP-binding protein [Verrucomicrobiae bacterium]|nr:ABC transporter ATP-binding protein [Verrucomicrobiae bacterium]